MNRFQLGAGLARWMVCGCAAVVASCGQTSQGQKSRVTAANEAGAVAAASAGSGGAAGGVAGGIILGGSLGVDDEAGSSDTGPVAVPLLDTTLCDNVFERVERLPDAALGFSGTFDDEPVEVSGSADVAEPPPFQVFRFGSTHVEAVGFPFYLPGGPYDGGLAVSAVDCGQSGQLFLRRDEGVLFYQLKSAALHTITSSVDGFSGLTRGSVVATWSNDGGEQHTLVADFTLRAEMGDARAQF